MSTLSDQSSLPESRQAGATPRDSRALALAIVVTLLMLAAAVFKANREQAQVRDGVVDESIDPSESYDPLPLPSSPSRNTDLAVGYVGSSACAECHESVSHNFHATAHSRSLQKTRAVTEPADASFVHAASHRRYDVYRKGEELWHRETLLLPDGEEIVAHEHRMDYTVGSGRFGKSYLTQVGDALVQSPVTWYTPRGAWGMSPGYDAPGQQSFLRVVPDGCLYCHSGRVQLNDGNPTHLTLLEEGIGCERCHGPGALHVERHQSGDWSGDRADLTIVNPANLSRKRQESLCAQCHRQAEAQVLVRGREQSDFRPGQDLDQFRIDFLTYATDEMSIVGHHAQLHRSRCYTESDDLTCITCHTPHDDVPADRAAAYFRSICNTCHTDDSCGVPGETREIDVANDCTQCHMPKAPTEVPHVAFTHHRIGIHTGASETSTAGARPSLSFSPIDVPDLPDEEMVRLLGLVHAAQARRVGPTPTGQQHLQQAAKLLTQAVEVRAADPSVRASMARIRLMQQDARTAVQLAASVLDDVEDPTEDWVDAKLVLAQVALRDQDLATAREHYAAIASARYNANYWFFLGLTEQSLGHTSAAVDALEQSLLIDPVQTGAHDLLAEIYRLNGQLPLAEEYQDRSEQIRAFLESMPGESTAP